VFPIIIIQMSCSTYVSINACSYFTWLNR